MGRRVVRIGETGNDNDGVCHNVVGVAPAMAQVRGEEQAVAAFKLVDRIFDDVLQRSAPTENKFMSAVDDRVRPAAAACF